VSTFSTVSMQPPQAVRLLSCIVQLAPRLPGAGACPAPRPASSRHHSGHRGFNSEDAMVEVLGRSSKCDGVVPPLSWKCTSPASSRPPCRNGGTSIYTPAAVIQWKRGLWRLWHANVGDVRGADHPGGLEFAEAAAHHHHLTRGVNLQNAALVSEITRAPTRLGLHRDVIWNDDNRPERDRARHGQQRRGVRNLAHSGTARYSESGGAMLTIRSNNPTSLRAWIKRLRSRQHAPRALRSCAQECHVEHHQLVRGGRCRPGWAQRFFGSFHLRGQWRSSGTIFRITDSTSRMLWQLGRSTSSLQKRAGYLNACSTQGFDTRSGTDLTIGLPDASVALRGRRPRGSISPLTSRRKRCLPSPSTRTDGIVRNLPARVRGQRIEDFTCAEHGRVGELGAAEEGTSPES
jgi:hypothetical protein